MPAARIAIIDRHELTVAGLTHVLTECREPRFEVLSPGHARPRADIVLYNVEQHLDGSHDPRLHALLRQTRSTIIATFRDETWPGVESALVCGVHGAVSMRLPTRDLVEQISRTHVRRLEGETGVPPEGSCYTEVLRTGLTPREIEVLGLIGAGLTNQEIADELYISLNTVKTYIRLAYRRIGAARRSQAVVWITRHGLARPVRAVARDWEDVAAG